MIASTTKGVLSVTIDAATAASQDGVEARQHADPLPGLVLIFADRGPRARVFRLEDGCIELGRMELAVSNRLDPLISRRHARFSFDGEKWQISDLGSRNGTFAAGNLLSGKARISTGVAVRVGGALLLPVADVTPFEQRGLGVVDGTVGGPSLRKALDAVAFAQRVGLVSSLMISGESGTGKEIAAKVFHLAGGKPTAPLSAVRVGETIGGARR